MPWKTIRLELARTPCFPEGSSVHAYVLRLPVNENGHLEDHVIAVDQYLTITEANGAQLRFRIVRCHA
jgi:hypothetical protein